MRREEELDIVLSQLPDEIIEALREGQCSACGKPWGRPDAFCSKCGTQNPHFDPKERARVIGRSHEAALKDCAAGHVGPLKDAIDFPRLYEELPYCPDCGALIVPN